MKMQQELERIDGVISLIDNILIYGKTQEEHDARLHTTLTRLEKAGITLNADKCAFSKSEVKFAGYIINAEGVKSDPEKTTAIKEMSAPKSVSEIRRFLGMLNQQGKFIPHLAEKARVLRDLLNKKNEFVWGLEQQKAFDTLKEELSNTPILAHYDPERETTVSADALSYGIGAVLARY
jgi:recombinational DNA repair protein (RecF pathway)